MSRTEFHNGTLGLITSHNIDDMAKLILLKEYSINSLPSDYNSYVEYLCDNYYYKFIVIDNKLYEINDTEIEEDDFTMEEIRPGYYKYNGGFYNGGTCLHEMLEEFLLEILSKK